MTYEQFLQSKRKSAIISGFHVELTALNYRLFEFQKFIVQRALLAGKYAIFADCGLGKTLMQLEWARLVNLHTEKPVLILAPLAVSGQTIQEGAKFGYDVVKIGEKMTASKSGIYITNYEQIGNINTDDYVGIVLDESSILKNFNGVTKKKLLEVFAKTPYKLACTATPAPNDLNELGNHSQFLDVMDSNDMRMRWFTHDNNTNEYRLKNHAVKDFFNWVSGWSSVLRTPSDIGYSDSGYKLPPLNYTEKTVTTDIKDSGKLFNDTSVSATEFNSELRITLLPRMSEVIAIVNNSPESFIIWINQNTEEDYLLPLIPDAVAVRGSENSDIKERKLLDFAAGKFRVLITKKKIAQFGMNFQNCNNQIFASLDFSFEGLYQSIRRSYRFGQTKQVNIYLITTDTMTNVAKTIKHKQKEFDKMMTEISNSVNSVQYGIKSDYELRKNTSEYHTIYNADCIDVIRTLPDNSIDFSIFSPPFSNLYTYSDNIRDMGNCVSDDEFFTQTDYLLSELYRIIKGGRLVAIHTKDLARYKATSGYSGMYDFTGEYHRAMEKAGFRYHSKITIWKDPVVEMQRTKTQRLLYKQVTSDSTYSGIGMPEYVTIFRKWDGNEDDWFPVTSLNKGNFPIDTWQKWASPVWFDISQTNVLNNYRGARDEKDEKHICPLQLDVIERCIALWSNEGETVFTPFAGIGSELWQAVKMKRKAIGIELKESYFDVAVKNLNNLIKTFAQETLL